MIDVIIKQIKNSSLKNYSHIVLYLQSSKHTLKSQDKQLHSINFVYFFSEGFGYANDSS